MFAGKMFKNNKELPASQIYEAFKPRNYKSNSLRIILSSLIFKLKI